MSESSPSNSELRESAAVFRVSSGADDLELPINREFLSLPPKLSPDQYVAWCEEGLRKPLTRLVSPPEDSLLPGEVFGF